MALGTSYKNDDFAGDVLMIAISNSHIISLATYPVLLCGDFPE